MKRLLIFSFVFTLFVLIVLFWKNKGSPRSPAPQTSHSQDSQNGNKLSLPKKPDSLETSPIDRPPPVVLRKVKYEPDYVAIDRPRENPPFEFRGGAGTGKVIDSGG